MPDIRLAGDIIIGFPTETDEDHAMSMQLIERARYKGCFIFKYSTRPGTASEKRFEDDIPDELKKQRNREMIACLRRRCQRPRPWHDRSKLEVVPVSVAPADCQRPHRATG